MAKKKSNSKKTTGEPILEKIAGKLGHFTGEVIVAKDHLVDMASGAIDSVKETIQHITEKKGAAPKKAVKAAVKKVEKAVAKKIAPAKKAGVPIVPIGFDYANKLVVIGEAFFPGDDEEADLKNIIAFYTEIQGKKPELDIRHLKK